MSNNLHNETALHWKWVFLSVIAGLLIVGASYFIVAPTFQSGEVQALVMLVGFIVTGAIIGYFSPGITINEASIGGFCVMIVMSLILYITKAEIQYTKSINLLLLLLGSGLAWVGGWAGEKLQGDPASAAEKGIKKFLWKWVIVGTIIGFALTVLFVFVLSTIFLVHLFKVAFVGFIVSFVITGFIVGYKSPGETLKEPAVAGVLSVLFDWAFLKFVLTLSVPVIYIATGLFIGFLLSFFGAWLGEKYQEAAEKKAEA